MNKRIELHRGLKDDKLQPVIIRFDKATNYCMFTVEELLQILRLWIKGEEMKYPISDNCKGRWLLFEEIEKVFNEGLDKPNA